SIRQNARSRAIPKIHHQIDKRSYLQQLKSTITQRYIKSYMQERQTPTETSVGASFFTDSSLSP
ncbi:MAG: hypothetical protein IIX15_04265, partial [Clostridia bacterium]|nr:hypothetical protein [Clostridia bacterium]